MSCNPFAFKTHAMLHRNVASLICLMGIAQMTSLIGCNHPTERELAAAKIQQVRANPTMPDNEAVQLLAEGYFRTDSVVISPDDQTVQIVARPADLSSMVDIGQDLEDANKRAQRAVIFFALQNLNKLTQAVKDREVGDIQLTLEEAVIYQDRTDWFPTYRLTLPPEKFDEFEALFDQIESAFGESDREFNRAFDAGLIKLERVWDVELDAFDQTQYERGER